jgi:hypothetical protein
MVKYEFFPTFVEQIFENLEKYYFKLKLIKNVILWKMFEIIILKEFCVKKWGLSSFIFHHLGSQNIHLN